MSNAVSDETLLQAWAEGDRDAGDALLRRHFDWVYKFFYVKLEHRADELAQQTMLACIEQVGRLATISSFRAYVLAIARNKLYGELRRHYAGRFDPADTSLLDALDGASGGYSRRLAERTLQQALQKLPLDEQMTLELKYWHDLSSREMGDVLGVPPPTIRARIGRAREHLRQALERGQPRDVSVDAVMRLLTD